MSSGGAERGAAPPGAILQYGGQAVIEGVMMRSPRYYAVACRKPDGTIVVQREHVDASLLGKLKWLNKPFLRGTLALIDAMVLGTRALAYASNVQMEAQMQQASAGVDARPASMLEAETAVAASIVNGPPVIVSRREVERGKINDIAIGGTIVFSFAFGIALFVLAPTLLTDGIRRLGVFGAHTGAQSLNIVDGLIRMAIFFGYIAGISMMPQIKRVFMYHGAEHKAINTLEADKPLSVDCALASSRIHPRCGTSFIFIVLVANLIVFAFLPRPVWYLRFPLHIAVIPLVAGIAYEVIKFAGKFRKNPLVMAILAPGMWSQYLTTREPRPDQIEVALTALKSVLEAEGHLAPAAGPAVPNRSETAPVIA